MVLGKVCFLFACSFPVLLIRGARRVLGSWRKEKRHVSSCLLTVLVSFFLERVLFTLLTAVGSGLQLLSTSWIHLPGAPQRCHQPVLRSLSPSPMWSHTERPSSGVLRGQHLPLRGLVSVLWSASSKLLDSDSPIPSLWFLPALGLVAASYSYSVSHCLFNFLAAIEPIFYIK